jgi:prolyl oligopeptidase
MPPTSQPIRSSRPIAIAVAVVSACATLTACDPGPAEEDTVALTYPETRRGDQVDDYFGTQVADPYRWFEDLDSAETAAWVKAQNDISSP